MAWKLLFLFLAVAAAFDEDYPDSYNPGCMERVYQECEPPGPDVEFPETREELEKMCKLILNYADCAINIYENCEASDEVTKTVYNAKKVFNNICIENTNLFDAIEQNLKCVKDHLDYFGQPCPLSPKETQDLNDVVNAFSAVDESAFLNNDMCLESLTRIGCLLSKVSHKCGDQAVDALMEILQQLDHPFERCGDLVKQNLELVKDVFMIGEELEEELQEMKKKKR